MSEAAANYPSEVEGFLDNLFEGGPERTYVYCPTKDPETAFWQEYWFQWPKHKEQIVTHLLGQTDVKECYVSPSLFKAPSDKKAAWKGSNFVWIDFDGNAPSDLPDGIPSPSIRIQSSTKGNEHWYWRLDSFETDVNVIEGLSKQLAYTLDADKSGWDASQVLRPPGTIHHESKRRVRLLSANQRPHSLADFRNLVEPPEIVVVDTKFTDLPNIDEVIAKYKFKADTWDLFKKQKVHPDRSKAMMRLACDCVELGMSSEELYVILYNVDERWGKFKNRNDRVKQLTNLISRARGTTSANRQTHTDQDDRQHFISAGDFKKRKVMVKWLYKGFLQDRGFGIISSLPGVGKSSMTFRLAADMILMKKFLVWEPNFEEPKRVGFMSLEMDEVEIQSFLAEMYMSMTPEEIEIFDKHFFILDRGYSMALWDKKLQQHTIDDIDNLNLDVLMIDSLKAAGGLDEKKAEAFYDWLNHDIRKTRSMTVWIIHHNRKPTNEAGASKVPQGLEDLYGSTYISAHASTVIALHPQKKNGKERLMVIPLKLRLAPKDRHFTLERLPGTVYNVVETVPQNSSLVDAVTKDSEADQIDPKSNGLFGGG